MKSQFLQFFHIKSENKLHQSIKSYSCFLLKYRSFFSGQYLVGYDISKQSFQNFHYRSFRDFFHEWDDSNMDSEYEFQLNLSPTFAGQKFACFSSNAQSSFAKWQTIVVVDKLQSCCFKHTKMKVQTFPICFRGFCQDRFRGTRNILNLLIWNLLYGGLCIK